MEVKYINSNGKEVNLNKYPYRMLVSDLLDYEWGIIGSANTISGFQSQIYERSVLIDVWKTKEKSSRVLMNELTDIFEFDIAAETPGRLYIDDSYILCYIYKSQKSNWETELRTLCEYGVIIDKSRWITEIKKTFYPVGSDSEHPYLDYDYDYDYDYTPSITQSDYINLEHYAPCNFQLKIYGPAIDPSVTIGGVIRQVYTTLEEGQYLLIDSRDKTVKRVLNDGSVLDEFDNRRRKPNSIFGLITPGMNEIIWDSIGFDLTLFIERSEPRWR